jgi:hypothetical protein
MKAAEVLDAQGEMILAGDVRYFVKYLPPVLTDRQKLATRFIGFIQRSGGLNGASPSAAVLRTRRCASTPAVVAAGCDLEIG